MIAPTTTTTAAAAASSSPTNYVSDLGLGYSIAISLGFLILLSTILLASYICCRSSSSSRRRSLNSVQNQISSSTDGIIVPRIIFVAENDGNHHDEESAAVGLDQAVINSYPKFQISKKEEEEEEEDSPVGVKNGGDCTLCSICLCEYKDLEMVRIMPECKHYFHLCCIDAWLKINGSCPVCRNSPLPTPISTPLSEVVPLSQYAADRRRR